MLTSPPEARRTPMKTTATMANASRQFCRGGRGGSPGGGHAGGAHPPAPPPASTSGALGAHVTRPCYPARLGNTWERSGRRPGVRRLPRRSEAAGVGRRKVAGLDQPAQRVLERLPRRAKRDTERRQRRLVVRGNHRGHHLGG